MRPILKFVPVVLASLSLSACDFSIFSDLFNTKVESISINESTIALAVNETWQLKVDLQPETVTDKKVSWTTENSSIATVSENGLVRALKLGITKVTVTSHQNPSIFASCIVDVRDASMVLSNITVSDQKTSYNVGDDFVKPVVTANYGDGSSKLVTEKCIFSGYISSKAGTQTVTVSYTETNITKTTSYGITVTDPSRLIKTAIQYDYDNFINASSPYISRCPSVGTPKVLVIPVWFTDSGNYITSSKKENVRKDIQNAYFGTESETGWHSVRSYYAKESFGSLNLQGTVSDWYSCGKQMSVLGLNNYVNQQTQQDQTDLLVRNAVKWYFNNNTNDRRSDYDTDGDGFLDAVMLIYGAPDCQQLRNDNYDNLWAYCYWLQDPDLRNINNPGPNVFFWASYDFMYGGNASSRAGSAYGAGDTSHCTIDAHTYIHEMGHVFGLEDYYDYSSQYSPAGAYSMQDHNVGAHDPYSVMGLGWTDPVIPTATQTITIKPFQKTGDVILLSSSWNTNNSIFDEYLLLELYTDTNLNEYDSKYSYLGQGALPQKAGIRLWHVDARLTDRNGKNISKVPSSTYYQHAFSNTYYLGSQAQELEGYLSPMGSSYYNYNLLQYIRNDSTSTYKADDYITSDNMFKAGSTFSMSSFSKQFVKGTKMNNGASLGWSFKVDSCSATSATITVTRG